MYPTSPPTFVPVPSTALPFTLQLFIFAVPLSLKELERRLRDRGTETEVVIQARIAKAKEEIPYASKYDYVIVNDVLEKAVEDFKAVINAESFKAENSAELLEEVIKNA